MINRKRGHAGKERMRRLGGFPLTLAALFLALLAGCGRLPAGQPAQEVPGGDPERGREVIREYGCGSCHTVPGVRDANATVGPPLDDWADRHFIAGQLSNTPDNLIEWIQSPQTISPGNAMPDMGVEEADARDIAAYLFTLRR